jgi:NAD(P)H-dependent FMN reductase
MPHIAILYASVRTDRNSHRTSLYFQNYLREHNLATVEIIDLKAYQFPVFEERIWNLPDPSPALLDYAARVKKADGIILVTPEYNGGYPASLKNAIDVLYDEWQRKPIAISTNSDGVYGGTQVITSLQWTLWKIRAWTVPSMFPVSKVQETFDENGVPADKKSVDKRAALFIKELLWCIEAVKRMA